MVRASKKITAQIKGNKFLKNGEPMYTYAHDLPARITMDFFQDNDTLTRRKQKEIMVALLASGSPVTNTVQRLGRDLYIAKNQKLCQIQNSK